VVGDGDAGGANGIGGLGENAADAAIGMLKTNGFSEEFTNPVEAGRLSPSSPDAPPQDRSDEV
jgi:hypothetical protein